MNKKSSTNIVIYFHCIPVAADGNVPARCGREHFLYSFKGPTVKDALAWGRGAWSRNHLVRTHRQVTLSVGAPREKEDPRISEIPSISKVVWNAEAVADLMVQGFRGGQRMDKRRKEARQKGFQKRADLEQGCNVRMEACLREQSRPGGWRSGGRVETASPAEKGFRGQEKEARPQATGPRRPCLVPTQGHVLLWKGH